MIKGQQAELYPLPVIYRILLHDTKPQARCGDSRKRRRLCRRAQAHEHAVLAIFAGRHPESAGKVRRSGDQHFSHSFSSRFHSRIIARPPLNKQFSHTLHLILLQAAPMRSTRVALGRATTLRPHAHPTRALRPAPAHSARPPGRRAQTAQALALPAAATVLAKYLTAGVCARFKKLLHRRSRYNPASSAAPTAHRGKLHTAC